MGTVEVELERLLALKLNVGLLDGPSPIETFASLKQTGGAPRDSFPSIWGLFVELLLLLLEAIPLV